jgi:ankyrin repeat protein
LSIVKNADDKSMKKLSLFFLAVIVSVTINCKSAPQENSDASFKETVPAKSPGSFPETPFSVENTAENTMQNSELWNLLRSGGSGLREKFLGEFDVHAVDPNGKTPLHYACENGDSVLAAFFISIGADVNALDNERMSPLGIVIEKRNDRIIELLAAANADIHLNIKNNTSAALMVINDQGGIINALLTRSNVETANSDGKTILHLAAIAGNVYAVNNILTVNDGNFSVINKRDNDKYNALDYSLKRPDSKNHMIISENLILAGAVSEDSIYAYFAPAARSANYNVRRNDGMAPIHYAVRDSYIGLILFLFDKKVDVNVKNSSGSAPLHEAARIGNIEIMRMLLEQGADVNIKDAKSNTAMHTGIPVNVHREALNLLFEYGADPNLRDEHGVTPLHVVILLNRNIDIIQTLLLGGSDVQIRNMDGKTPLYIAVQERRVQVIPLLLDYNADVFAADITGITPFDMALKIKGDVFKTIVTPDTVLQNDSSGNTMLHVAVINRGDSGHFALILDHKALVDTKNRQGDTALHIAVKTNQQENGEFLISRGANIFSPNSAGHTPLYLALSSSNTWFINSTTAIAKDGLGNNILHYACLWKLTSAIPLIIQRGVSTEDKNATGETPLFMAVRNDSTDIIRVLVDNKANINARDSQGNTLLQSAIRWNAIQSSAMLITYGIDINAHSLNGNTALHDAVNLGILEILNLLLAKGADTEVRDLDGNTPFMEAIKAGYVPSIEMLADYSADALTRNIRGDTPLHIAVSYERYDLVSMLLRMGASIHARNISRRTPYQIALSQSPRMVSALLTKDRINLPDDLGNSVLHIALQEGANENIIAIIIDQGIRLNSVDNNGRNALRLAIDLDMSGKAKMISDAGSDPFLTAVDNKTSAEVAISKGIEYAIAVFSGKSVNAKDSSLNTVLHTAARYGNPEIIRTLIELGANKTLKNIAGETPEDIARRWNKPQNVEALR